MTALWLIVGLILGAAAAALLLAPRLKRLTAHNSELGRDLVRAQADLEHEHKIADARQALAGQAFPITPAKTGAVMPINGYVLALQSVA